MSNLSAALGDNFDASQHEDQNNDYGPLPKGKYYAKIENVEVRKTNSGNGMGVNVTFEILGNENGEYAGRKVFEWYNTMHANEKAQQIGLAQFAALCKSIGVQKPQETDEILGLQVVLAIGIDKKDPERNRVNGYYSVNDSPAPQQSAPKPQTQPQAAPKPSSKPAWMK